jgi:hypothetical protein
LPWLLAPGEHRARLTLLGERGTPERVTVTLHVPEAVAPPARIYLPLGMR